MTLRNSLSLEKTFTAVSAYYGKGANIYNVSKKILKRAGTISVADAINETRNIKTTVKSHKATNKRVVRVNALVGKHVNVKVVYKITGPWNVHAQHTIWVA